MSYQLTTWHVIDLYIRTVSRVLMHLSDRTPSNFALRLAWQIPEKPDQAAERRKKAWHSLTPILLV